MSSRAWTPATGSRDPRRAYADVSVPRTGRSASRRLRAVLERYRSARFIIELKTAEAELARRTIDEVRAAGVRRPRCARLLPLACASRSAPLRAADSAPAPHGRRRGGRSIARGFGGRSAGRSIGSCRCRSGSVTTVIVTPRFIAHAHRAGLPVKDLDGRRRARTWSACSTGARTASSATAPMSRWQS